MKLLDEFQFCECMLHLIILCGRAVLYRFGVQRDIREKKRKEEEERNPCGLQYGLFQGMKLEIL